MLPPNYPRRVELHGEIHARPHARIRLPALVTNVSLLNAEITIEQELEALRKLPGQENLGLANLSSNFIRLRIANYMVKWERHGEFTRYSLTQALPPDAHWGCSDPKLSLGLAVPQGWLASLPGETISATQLALVATPVLSDEEMLSVAREWLGAEQVVAARIGAGYAMAFTDFRLRSDGFCRYVAVAESLSETRAGRVSSRLLELENYRMLALLGWPVARLLTPLLKESEAQLADITKALEAGADSDSALLHRLIALASQVEGATAVHSFRFAATTAYQQLVQTRIAELRESRLVGVQTFSEFLNRRFLPAMATVESTHRRLKNLSERIERSSAMIRTRADIVREEQNQRLLEKLTEGQRMQLRLQQTVEGLSIAAISYYVISLLGYGFKAVKFAGVALNIDLAVGIAVPIVLLTVGYLSRRIRNAK